jgi:uncharacterized protein YdeI (YjbR/CyaY-like superfamily)
MSVKNIIDAVEAGKPSAIKKAFEFSIKEKTADALEAKKIEVASKMFSKMDTN